MGVHSQRSEGIAATSASTALRSRPGTFRHVFRDSINAYSLMYCCHPAICFSVPTNLRCLSGSPPAEIRVGPQPLESPNLGCSRIWLSDRFVSMNFHMYTHTHIYRPVPLSLLNPIRLYQTTQRTKKRRKDKRDPIADWKCGAPWPASKDIIYFRPTWSWPPSPSYTFPTTDTPVYL